VPASCEAMSYHSNYYSQTHRVKYEKDSQHTQGYTVNSSDPQTTSATQPYEGKGDPGVLHKFVMYRVPDATVPGGYAMKLETWIDETGSGKVANFKNVLETLDNGKWGPTQGGNSACGCGEFVVLNMDKCASGIRVDFMSSFKWKDWSIRSISPAKPLHADAKKGKAVSPNKDELVQTKKEVEIIASQAENPQDRKDASVVARKMDDIVQKDIGSKK
jgi:hypothetical protein